MPSLHVEVFGAGPPLVAIHGFGASIYTWRHVRDVLSAHHTVYAFDLKGHGQSPKPDDGRYSVHDQAALIREYIVAKGLRGITLVGHSFGGGVALSLAVDLGRTAPGTLAKLVVMDGAAYRQAFPSFITMLRLPVIGWLSQVLVPVDGQVRFVLKQAFYRDESIKADDVRAYGAALRMPGGAKALRETAKQILPADIDEIAAQYPGISVPTLVIWGRQDEIIPLWVGDRLSEAIPHARLHVIDGVGHVPHEETPELVRPALAAFLNT